MKTLILTPNKNLVCGMYQLSKDLAKEFDGDIGFKDEIIHYTEYDQVITLFYPMHNFGKDAKRHGAKWICYNQGIPPVTEIYFPNFWRRSYMQIFTWLNNRSMKGADEYWDVTEREQKPRWTEKSDMSVNLLHSVLGEVEEPYAIYLGRTTDYKNFEWLTKIMEEFEIALVHPENLPDEHVHALLSNAKMYVTASLWEGYGRPVHESENLGVPAVSYDVGAHKRHTKKGICVPLDINNMKASEELFKKAVLEVWSR